MTKKNSLKNLVIITVITFLTIIISIHFLDADIAIGVMHFIRSIRPLHRATENIPDILPDIVALGTLFMWVIYFYRLYKKKNDVETHFLLLAATTLPVSYILKTFLKYMFGRTNPRSWILHHKPLVFDWFHHFGSGSFPSGHMTVFVAFCTALLFYYPKYRKIVLIFLVLLGISLIGTDYHFLSDVIGGAYLGYITSYILRFILEKISSKFRSETMHEE